MSAEETFHLLLAGAAVGVALAFVLRRKRTEGTTLTAPLRWTLFALLLVCFSLLVETFADLGTSAEFAIRYLASTSTLCPLMAILGAKRPQNTGLAVYRHHIVAGADSAGCRDAISMAWRSDRRWENTKLVFADFGARRLHKLRVDSSSRGGGVSVGGSRTAVATASTRSCFLGTSFYLGLRIVGRCESNAAVVHANFTDQRRMGTRVD